ncbi:hypothetical protein, partial [Pseudomonas aeruginosa]|uniref:hypothetical protein n=1 Tax=Pseudomonas aeruginosa TaxID=287 RepID=UPI002155FA68
MTPEGRMHGLFLGIDCGTQGSKALLLDAGSGRTLGLGLSLIHISEPTRHL